MFNIVVIGAGAIGSFVARQLARYDLKIALLEKKCDVACGVTRANTAIVHSGYSGKPGTLKAKLTVDANADFENICAELDVGFSRTGSLLVALSEKGIEKIEEKYSNGLANGVEGMQIINGDQAREMEPRLNPKVIKALYVPSTGIVNPWEWGLAAAENAIDNGVELFLETEVKNITRKDGLYKIETPEQTFTAKYVINCAGLHSDEISNLIAEPFFRVVARRGEYLVLDTEAGDIVSRVIFNARGKEEIKGIIVVPTVHGNVLVGPSAEDVDDKTDTRTTAEKMDYIKQIGERSITGIPYEHTIRSFAGLRPRPRWITADGEETEDNLKDFIIGEPDGAENFINCAGIKSPGLTCANEIGKYVAGLIAEKEPGLKLNPDFNPCRRPVVRFHQRPTAEQAELIRQNPQYGNMVCRCRKFTEAEIVDAIRRNAGAHTIDGVKRRTGAGLGRCQGGFCTPGIIKILSRELGVPPEQIRKDSGGSELLTGRVD